MSGCDPLPRDYSREGGHTTGEVTDTTDTSCRGQVNNPLQGRSGPEHSSLPGEAETGCSSDRPSSVQRWAEQVSAGVSTAAESGWW